MNIQQLRYFVSICECRSMSKAAQKLFISQQGLSRSIQHLEEELSCTLLERHSRGVSPTEDGLFLLERARAILPEADLCDAYFSKPRPESSGISIASAYGILPELAAGALRQFSAENPHVRLSITEYTDKDCDDAVFSGHAELGFTIEPVDDARFEVVPLYERKLCILVNRNGKLGHAETIQSSDLAGLSLVTMNDNFKCPEVFAKRCRELGVKSYVRAKVGEIMAVHRMVISDPTLTGLTVDTVVKDVPHTDAVGVPFADEGFSYHVCLIWKKGAVLSPAAKSFTAFLQRSEK